jgi:hypothetical protein
MMASTRMLNNLAESGVPWVTPRPALKGKRLAVVARSAAHHDGILPVGSDEPYHPRTCSIPLQEEEAAFPIDRIEGFMEVKEDTVEWLQLEVGKLLGQLGLDNRSTSPAVCTTPMKDVMQVHHAQLQINDPLQHLPDGFK